MDTPSELAASGESTRTGTQSETLRAAILQHLCYVAARLPQHASKYDYFIAAAYTVRDRLIAQWLATHETYLEKDARMVAYLSAEFLLGPHLANNLLTLGIETQMREALQQLGLGFD